MDFIMLQQIKAMQDRIEHLERENFELKSKLLEILKEDEKKEDIEVPRESSNEINKWLNDLKVLLEDNKIENSEFGGPSTSTKPTSKNF